MNKQKRKEKLLINYYKDMAGEHQEFFRKANETLQKLWVEMCKD
jgi:hypothetical protein